MYSVILIDDEPVILEGLKKAIPWNEYGFEDIIAVQSAAQALELMGSKQFDLCVTDIRMPEMDGLTLLKKVRTLYPHMSCVILTAYDEFDYVLEALRLGAENFLLKPINTAELTATVRKALDNINHSRELDTFLKSNESIFKENVLYRWATGDLSGQELSDRAKLASDGGINLYKRCYNTLIVKPLSPDPAYEQLLDVCQGLLSSNYECYRFSNPSGWQVFIIGGRTASPSDIKSLLSPSMQMSQTPSLFIAVIGTEALGSANLPFSYQSALEIITYSMLFESNSLLNAEEIRSNRDGYNVSAQINIEELLTLERDEDALAKTTAFVESIGQETDASLPTVRALLTEFLLQFARQIEKVHLQKGSLPDSLKNMFARLNSLGSQAELSQWLNGIVLDARHLIRRDSLPVSPIVSRVLQYVKVHYCEAMSIKKIAAHFSVNPSYLGYLFKQETNLYFSDYLNQIRIQEAERLLLSTDRTMSEIASKVGYSDVTYFNQIFKKYNGISPAKFRQAKKGV